MMLIEALKKLNWVDITAVILLLRIGYVALQNGLFLESFKFSGTVLAVYLSLHYYNVLGGFLADRIGIKALPLESLSFLSFVILIFAGYLFFKAIRELFARFIKMEPVAGLDKWGGFVLGVARGFLLTSLVIFMLAVFPGEYFKKSVKKSFSGQDLINVSIAAYSGLWNAAVSKFMVKEKFNENVLEVKESLERKK